MQISSCLGCKTFPCTDVRHAGYQLPEIELDTQAVSIVMISEAAPERREDYYYAGAEASFQQTTLLAFSDAGLKVSSIQELVQRGFYFTTAVKCGKTGYGIRTDTIHTCGSLLAEELSFFPNVKAWLLMGDVAIKAINRVARLAGQERVIPVGSTYKIRAGNYYFREARAFPSYLQVGPSFNIEKSKRRMIAEDIAAALRNAE